LKDCLKKLLQPFFPELDLDDIDVAYGPDWLLNNRFNKEMEISAMTFGNHILFNPDRETYYNENTRRRVALLAHELTHSVQAKQAGVGFFVPAYLTESGYRELQNLTGQRAGGRRVDNYWDNRFEADARRSSDEIMQTLDERYGPKLPCEHCYLPW
jgi:hypothetical protein